MMKRRLLLALPLLVLAAIAPLSHGTAFAATLTVCPSGCPYSTIQSAINAAGSGDTISISANTYSENLTINQSLTLAGSTSGTTTIDGSNGSVITINAGTVTLQYLTISGGNAYDGGGIYNNGTLAVTNSTISSNSASYEGGGIYNDGTATVANSTISGNSAFYGGGIFDDGGTLTVTNSTISGNSAFYGGYVGGLYNHYGTATLTNTILADNTDTGVYPDCYEITSGSGGHNLIGNDSNCAFNTNGSTGNQVGTSSNPIDPKLGPLANNGGPTQTQALLTGSPALGAGDEATCLAAPINNLDQRGYTRRNPCSIGAWDRPPSDLTTTLTLSPMIVSPDETIRVDATVTNTSSTTESVTLSETVTVPNGYEYHAVLGTITIGPGKTIGGAYTYRVSRKVPSGTYTVTFTATDSTGSSSSTATETVS